MKTIILLGSKSSANEVNRDDMQVLDEVTVVQGTVCQDTFNDSHWITNSMQVGWVVVKVPPGAAQTHLRLEMAGFGQKVCDW